MQQDDKKVNPNHKRTANPIITMIEKKKRIVEAIKNGDDLSALKGIKIVSPL